MALALLRRAVLRCRSVISHAHFTHLNRVQVRSKPIAGKRRFRALLHESLELRAMMAANPIARNDMEYYTPANTNLVVTTSSLPAYPAANDLDIDSTSLTYGLVVGPTNGTILAFNSNGTFTYRPNAGFAGVDTFTYRISDGLNIGNTATIGIAVGTRLLARQNLDSNYFSPLGNSMDLFSQEELTADGQMRSNIPEESSLGTDGSLAASGGLQLQEVISPDQALVYRSNSLTNPVIAVDTQLAPGVAVPTSISASLTFNGVAGTSYAYSTMGLVSGQAMRFALQANGSSLPTGIYDYTLTVTMTVSGTPFSQSFSGKQAIVNRSASEYGAGWYLDGLDQLYDSAAGALMVKGNGDTLWFAKSEAGYLQAAGDLEFCTLIKSASGTYVLTTKNGTVSNFSALGLLTSVVDPNGNTTALAYADRSGDGIANELISITDPFGRVTNISYTAGKVTSVNHFSGRTTTMVYSGANLVSYTLPDPDGTGPLMAPSVSFSNTGSQLTSRTNPLTQMTSFTFGTSDGRLRTVTYPDLKTWQLNAIDTIGLPTALSGNMLRKPIEAQATITDQRNNGWKFRTDRFGGVTESITALGFVRTALRDANGNPYVVNEPDPDGIGPLSSSVTFLGYNTALGLTHVIAPDGGVTTMTYSSSMNRLLSVTDPLNRTETFTYNVTGNMLTSVDGARFTTTYAYNTRGLPTSITPPDPDGTGPLTSPVTRLAYDSLGRVVTLTNPDSSTQAFTYNAADQMLTNVDELGKTSSFVYDALGRIISYTNRVNATTQWSYDGMSRMARQIDALGGATDVEYNNRGWVSKVIYPDPDGVGPLSRSHDNRVYDEVGNLQSQGDARGNFQGVIPYTYDIDNRLKTIGSSVDVNLAEVYNYDNAGRLTSIDRVAPPPSGGGDAIGGILVTPPDRKEYGYDAMGRVNQYRVYQPNSAKNYFAYSSRYNLAGEKISQTDGRGNTQTFTYDARGLLAMQTSPDPDGSGSQYAMAVSYNYDNMSRPIRVNRSAERITSYEYNVRSWLTKITEPDPDRSGPLTSPVTTIGYNLRGDQTSVTDPMARLTIYTFDNEQRLIGRTDPDPDGTGPLLSPVTSWTYNANDWLIGITNPAGAQTVFSYDSLGRLKSKVSPDPDDAGILASPITTFGYDMQGLASITDPMTRVTRFVRDNRGRISSITDTAESRTDFTYDFYDNLLTQTRPDPDGVGPVLRPVIAFTYDALDRMTSQLDPMNGLTKFEYDAASNLTSVVDPVNNVTQYGYDSWNRRTVETNMLSQSRSYVYDTAGNMTRTVDRNGKVIQYVYDALDRPIEEKWKQTGAVTPSLIVTTIRDGSITNEQQTVGWRTTTSSVTNMTGTFRLMFGPDTTVPIAWNANAATIQAALEALPSIGAGNVLVDVVASTSPTTFGRTMTLNFRNGKSGQNLPQTIIAGSLVQTPVAPTPTFIQSTVLNGSTVSEQQQLVLSSVSSGSSGTWRVAYNGEVSGPLSPTIFAQDLQTVLNNFASIDNVTVSGGVGPQYTVTFGGTQAGVDMQPIFGDAANISNSSVRSITTTYNADNEVLSVNDPTSNVNFVRDNLGRATTIASTVNGAGFSMGQSFDVVGNRTELRASGSGTLDFRNIYSYDKLNRLLEVVQTNQVGGNQVLPKRVSFTYNALGQRTQIARFQSTGTANPVATTDFTYDFANRLSGIAHKQGTTNLNTYSYTYDPLSRLTSVNSTLEGLSSYTYWQNDQLVGVTNSGAANESYAYDANGNRNTTGFTTTTDNRMTTSPGFRYLYDNEGNLIRKTNTTNGSYTLYTWDHRNRLTKATERTFAGSFVSEINYEYDAFNRLSKRYPTAGAITSWVYDEGINPVFEYNNSASPSMTHRYLWSDNVDELLADEQNPGLSYRNILWSLADQLGSIRDIADANETTGITSIANHRRYDGNGKRLTESNPAVDLIFGYTGKMLDEATGLQNNLNRWYDSQTGRWISQDPIGFGGGDANLYRYVGNSPTNATDPSGLVEDDEKLPSSYPLDFDDKSTNETEALRWKLYWEGFSKESRDRVWAYGCGDLAAKRLGMLSSISPAYGRLPFPGNEGIHFFTSSNFAFEAADRMVKDGKRVRIFVFQTSSKPSSYDDLDDQQKARSLPFEDLLEINPYRIRTGNFNFATLHWDGSRYYWEYVADGHTDRYRKVSTGKLPSYRQGYGYNYFGVVEITDEKACNATGLPRVPWEE